MKKILFILLFIGNIAFANNFEGSIKYSIKVNGNEMEMTDFTKGEQSAMLINAEHMTMKIIFDSKSKKMLMVMDAQKMVMEMDLEDAQKMVMEMDLEDVAKKSKEMGNSDTENSVPKKTGKTKTIAGLLSEEYQFDSKDEQISIWIAKEFGITLDKATLDNILMISNPEAMRNHRGKISLASWGVMAIESKSSSIVAQEVNKKTLDASFFSVPEGYNKMQMPKGMGGKQ